MSTGYSGTPLVRKLGIKPGGALLLVDAPPHYAALVDPLPPGVTMQQVASSAGPIVLDGDQRFDFVHAFVTSRALLVELLPLLRGRIVSNGMVWISWPKRSARVATDVTEDVIRELALAGGLVDTKVCAVDEVWSGLRLVIRLKDRPSL
jgi:hypothetical protein